MSEKNSKSPHILNASSNLLGICFVVLTSLKVLKLDGETYIDEFTTVAIFLFMTSCTTSFLAIRSHTKRSNTYEAFADVSFLSGIAVLVIATLLIAFSVMK